MTKNLLCTFMILIMSASFSLAQRGIKSQETQVPSQRTCGTQILDESFEIWLQQKIAERKNDPNARNAQYTIPVVFHIIHNGEAIGTGTNISNSQILSQLEVLNEDFRKLNSDITLVPALWTASATDSEINFCMAVTDNSGNPMATAGVNRINRTTAGFNSPPFGSTYFDNTIKPATIWNPNNYLNIWVANLSGGILGYATFPANSTLSGLSAPYGTTSSDGVVILYNALGRTGNVAAPYNKGRTATHEVGHWLGLRHIWGDSNCGTDYCTDTPVHNASNFGCPSQPHNSTCSGTPREMTMNYMDYTDDACMYMFTNDQKTRMQTVMANSPFRVNLALSTKCNAVNSPPVVNFTANNTTIPAGGSVNFTDLSTNTPTGWAWTFPGSSTPTANIKNPSAISYATAGTYDVSLTATNSFGNGLLTKTGYITVLPVGGTVCDTVSNFLSTNTPSLVGSLGWGYISGHNNYDDRGKADKFPAPPSGTTITGAQFGFARAYAGNAGSSISMKIWDGASGTPGAVLGTKTVLTNTLSTTGQTTIMFDTPVAVSASYFLGITFNANGTPQDTIALIHSADGETTPGTAWELWNDNSWHAFSETPASWGMNVAQMIRPIRCYTIAAPAPVADFTANFTTIPAGGSVNFTDLSTNTPTGWVWTFTGAATTASTSQNPTGIIYNTPGCYNVSLTATNAGGSNMMTKTCYITVTSTTPMCDTVSNYLSGNTQSLIGSGIWGYISGHNDYDDRGKADYFPAPPSGYQINGARFGFARAYAANGTRTISMKIWNGSTGAPGAVIATKTVTINSLSTTGLHTIMFDTPVTITTPYFLGVEFAANGTPQDTIALWHSADGETMPGTAWEKWNDNSWHAFSEDPASWGVNVAQQIYPIRCPISTGFENENDIFMSIYPNPNNGQFFADFSLTKEDNVTINVYSMLGEKIFSTTEKQTLGKKISIDLSNRSNGIYMVEFRSSTSSKMYKVNLTR